MTGRCYEGSLTILLALNMDGLRLAQGVAWNPAERLWMGHAWLEVRGVMVLDHRDPTRLILKDMFYRVGKVRDVFLYTAAEAERLMNEHEHCGPWEGLVAEQNADLPVGAPVVVVFPGEES